LVGDLLDGAEEIMGKGWIVMLFAAARRRFRRG
jgi:hypothetical protein